MTPTLPKTSDCNRTGSGSKPSLCLITQRKHRPAGYLVFALSTNTMQKETIGLPEQLLFLCFCLFDCIVFRHMQREIGRGRRGVGCLMGKGSQTKLKTEWKKWIILKWFPLYVFGFSNAVKQQYILNLTNVWLYFVGEREYGNSCFLQRLTEPETEGFFLFHPPSSLLIPPPSSSNPHFSFQGWCRRVLLRRDRAHLNGE